MTDKRRKAYQDTDDLQETLKQLKGKKFRLDCGTSSHFGHFLGNDITIRNGKEPKITCSQCGYLKGGWFYA